MENCTMPLNLKDHNYCQRRITAHRADGARKPRACRKDLCSSKDQPQVRSRPCVRTVSLPRKRRRSPVSRPSRPSRPSVRPPENLVPRSAISPADLPVASDMPPSPQLRDQLSCSDDAPLKIHNHSVEDYQRIYHEVVDSMMRYKSGRPRPYSLNLGRQIKQKLWDRLNRPAFITSTNQDGLVQIDIVYGQGANPPLHDIDTSGEPAPRQPPSKRAKKKKKNVK